MATLTFEASTHEYRIDGVVTPSVTQILKRVGLIDWVNYGYSEKLELGTEVHEWTAQLDRGLCSVLDAPEHIQPWLRAWESFLAQTGMVPLVEYIEKRVFSDDRSFAGTLDRVLLSKDKPLILGDIKTGSAASWHPLQTAAYHSCLNVPAKRASIYLDPTLEIPWRIVPHNERSDIAVFRAALTQYQWMAAHGYDMRND